LFFLSLSLSTFDFVSKGDTSALARVIQRCTTVGTAIALILAQNLNCFPSKLFGYLKDGTFKEELTVLKQCTEQVFLLLASCRLNGEQLYTFFTTLVDLYWKHQHFVAHFTGLVDALNSQLCPFDDFCTLLSDSLVQDISINTTFFKEIKFYEWRNHLQT
jgi:hypothetical protein